MPELKREITVNVARKFPEYIKDNGHDIWCESCRHGFKHTDGCFVPDLIHYREKCERLERVSDRLGFIVKSILSHKVSQQIHQEELEEWRRELKALADLKDEAKEGV